MRIIRGAEIDFVPASHEDQERPGVLRRMLAARDELTDGRVQMINWARLPAKSEFRSHFHEDMEEVFIILSGRVEMTVNGETTPLDCGDAVVVAPREVHKMRNMTDSEIDYIVIGISTGQDGRTVVVDT